VSQARPGWDDYSAKWALLHGGYDPRRDSGVVRLWFRLAYVLGRGLGSMRLTPSVVTLAGVLLSVAVPIVVVFGGLWLFAAAGLVFLAALADSADGALAVTTSRATRLGAFYDSVADRISEACWLLALWIMGVPGWLVAACGGLAWLHEYARARASVAGMRGIGVVTAAERPTRIVLVIAALVLGGVAWIINPRLIPGAATIAVAAWIVAGILGGTRLLSTIRTALTR
jgi:CDP-diacylglycerol--glycerol-3-phosphate 3-phosphatidyltransferase